MKNIIILLLLAACSTKIQVPEVCVLEGTYETASFASPECGGAQVFVQNVPRTEMSCTRHVVTSANEALTVCQGGEPSEGCEGFVNNVNGCSHNVWIRKVN
jgi:hypothetical protein